MATSEELIENKKRFAIADALWVIREDPTSGLITKIDWEDCMILGDRLYSFGYRREENES